MWRTLLLVVELPYLSLQSGNTPHTNEKNTFMNLTTGEWRNTEEVMFCGADAEVAEHPGELAEEFGDRRVGILTSAWHLPRAMRLAESAGVQAVPVPSNFIGRGVVRNTPVGAIIRDCVPHHDALMINARAMKEYLATIVRR